ncbi:MAG: phosphoglycerate dehydrogenase [Bdellovibrionaceae bacterium]|nr:phosphoglycerate dehydrogenase [Pseudobdellovibrionaceae bacterium]MDW8190026.1 phosphoglycerate dehydrogenase [Pseudobdellovibrionaceae bacterium]
MNRNYKILLLENIHPIAKQLLEERGHQVELQKSALSASELDEILAQFDVLGIRSKTEIRRPLLLKHKHLLAIGCFCIGTNQVDLLDARLQGIPVFNAPHSNTRSVAEMVVAEIIALSRNLFDRSMQAHQGKWVKTASGSFEVRGKTVGIVGYGHIGSQVSVLLEGLGMKVIFYDIVKKLPIGNAKPVATLNDLLRQSDFVTLHVPATPQTKNMIAEPQLLQMKKGSYLLNLSRGNVVDVDALARFLKNGHLAGAAIDVFPVEPKSNDEVFVSPLQGLKNVILTPHIGGSTEEAQEAIGREVARSFIEFLNHGSTIGAVNFPQAFLAPSAKAKVRLLNVHKNEPGVLGNINHRIGKLGGNIVGQSLVTDEQIGYTIIDIEGLEDTQELQTVLEVDFPQSIRSRLVLLTGPNDCCDN